MEIRIVDGLKHKAEIKALFGEYTHMLVSNDSDFADYLALQNYDNELQNLEEKYGLPYGKLHLIFCDNEVAGCIALRRIDDFYCEMKRLYIRPKFRKHGLGTILVKRIITDASEIGYSAILLDTFPFLDDAIRLYKSLGFYDIPSYNNSPMDNLIYLRLDL